MKMKNFKPLLTGIFIIAILIAQPTSAEEVNIEMTANSEEIVVESIAIISEEEIIPDDIFITNENITEMQNDVSENETKFIFEETIDGNNFEIIADVSSGNKTTTFSIENLSDAVAIDSVELEEKNAEEDNTGTDIQDEKNIESNIETTTIHLQLETIDGTIFDKEDYVVESCEYADQYVLTAWCAIQQVAEEEGLGLDYTDYGGDLGIFLVSITSDFGTHNYPSFFVNNEWGPGLSNYHLQEYDHILLVGETYPLKLDVSTTTPEIGTTTTISVYEAGYDENWNAGWFLSVSSTILVNGETVDSDSGVYPLDVTTTSEYLVHAVKDGFVGTGELTLSPITTTGDQTEEEIEDDPPGNGGSGGGTSKPNTETSLEIMINKAFEYLYNEQLEDGSFEITPFTDWVAIAFGKYDFSDDLFTTAKNNLKTFLQDVSENELTLLTDYERHILARSALDLDGYIYQQNILDKFDGQQFGSPALINDDIFAIISLCEIGYCINEIETAAENIRNDFVADNFYGIDLTAAAIRALLFIYPSTDEAIANAKVHLQKNQELDGGFNSEDGRVDSTSWVMDAIGKIGDTSFDGWTNNGKTPLDYLSEVQNDDGSFGETNKVWSTAYGLIALSHDWSLEPGTENNLVNEDETTKENNSTNQSSGSNIVINTTTTTEIMIDENPTSTLDFIIETPNSTPSSTTKAEQSEESNDEEKKGNENVNNKSTKDTVSVEIVPEVTPVRAILGKKINDQGNSIEKEIITDEKNEKQKIVPVKNENKSFINIIMNFIYNIFSSGLKFLSNLI